MVHDLSVLTHFQTKFGSYLLFDRQRPHPSSSTPDLQVGEPTPFHSTLSQGKPPRRHRCPSKQSMDDVPPTDAIPTASLLKRKKELRTEQRAAENKKRAGRMKKTTSREREVTIVVQSPTIVTSLPSKPCIMLSSLGGGGDMTRPVRT